MTPDEKLDAEALELLRAATGEPFAFFPAQDGIADFWRRAAVKARELHGKAEPRFVVRTAKYRPKPFWIVHDTETGRIYPFGFGDSAERHARTAAVKLGEGTGFYMHDPFTKNYL